MTEKSSFMKSNKLAKRKYSSEKYIGKIHYRKNTLWVNLLWKLESEVWS